MIKNSHITSYKHWAWNYLKGHLDKMAPSDPANIIDAMAVIIYSEIDDKGVLGPDKWGLPVGKEIDYTPLTVAHGGKYWAIIPRETAKAWDFTAEEE